MHPVLFRIGSATVTSYGALVAAGLVGGLFLTLRLAKRDGLHRHTIIAAYAIMVVGALLGGRLHGYGALLGAVVASSWFSQSRRFPFFGTADVLAPALALNAACVSLGCYVSGSDTHPTRLHEALFAATAFALLLRARTPTTFSGQNVLVFVFGYGVFRYFTELLRDDPTRGGVPPVLSQHLLFAFGAFLLATGYAVAFSKAVRGETLRRVTTIAAFAPALVLYAKLRVDGISGDGALSWSQFLALATALAASVAFAVRHEETRPRETGTPGLSIATADRRALCNRP